MSQGQQPGEELLPQDENASAGSASSEPSFNQNDIDQLKAMGFSENRCKRALLNTGHNGADIAMSWMFEHMEDPGKENGHRANLIWSFIYILLLDIDDPLPATASNDASNSGPSEDQISTLQDMGFSAAQAKKALSETVSSNMFVVMVMRD